MLQTHNSVTLDRLPGEGWGNAEVLNFKAEMLFCIAEGHRMFLMNGQDYVPLVALHSPLPVLQYKWLIVKILNNIKYDVWKTAEKDTNQFFFPTKLVNTVKGLLTTNEIPLTETLWYLVNVSNTNP